jgi:hypothetical protein
MAVKIGAPQGGAGGGKGMAIGMGLVTGGLKGAGQALLQSGNPKAAGLINRVEGFGKALEPAALKGQDPQTDAYTPPAASAIDRRFQTLSSDPQMTVLAGLEALRDPSVPDDIRQSYAEPLLRGKYAANRGIQ